ncbi:hypothetical protein [Chryseobacterium echinoideorum]|uniref:hypothetical protein n=1 Tax=Chryseobacterium echinoideorum TaxID=1549648 RepID=UPI001184F3E6|nr:hypothetical protein [Chryseobacterium echinoideorum]
MRKIQLIYIFITTLAYSQSQQLNFGDFPKPVPSASYTTTYQEMPVSTASGVPDISIPLAGIPSHDQSISENISLSYNPYNVNNEDFVSDVGLGWTLFSGGIISRQIVGDLDELFDNSSSPNYNVNAFNDLYYYTLPSGISGKFKIQRDIANNTFVAVSHNRNNVLIEFTRSNNSATLIVNSFTLTDDRGYKYVYNDFSQSLYTGNKTYRSAFYITSIKNPQGMDLLTYEYQKNNQYVTGTSTLLYQNCKIKKINSPGLGKIDFEYTHNAFLDNTFNDPYSVSKIKAQNNHGQNLYEYNFEYSLKMFSTLNGQKRVLDKIIKKNFENPSSPEITRFEYNTSGLQDNITIPNLSGISCMNILISETTPYPAESIVGILKKIHLPTGGAIEYEFEPNEYFFDKNAPSYLQNLNGNYVDPTIQSLVHIGDFSYSNTNNNSLAIWNLAGDPTKQKRIYFVFNAGRDTSNPFTQENPGNFYAAFNVDSSSSNNLTSCGAIYSDENNFSSTTSMLVNPGQHTITFPGIYVSGTLSVFELINTAPPYKNIDFAHGVRIKSEKYFNSSNSGVPDKIISYSYNLFENNNSSSGYRFYNENAYSSSEFVLYKNVKISEGENMGYTHNYFKLPSDYPETLMNIDGVNRSVKNYYNLTQNGLLSKKSIFNSNNIKVKELTFDYELEHTGGPTSISTGYGYMRPGEVKKLNRKEYDFLSGSGTIVSETETIYENRFRINSITSRKQTHSDGTVDEEIFTYPNLLTLAGQTNEYQHLIDNNIKSIPISITKKRNGNIISSVTTKFANNSLYPTSIISNNPTDGSIKTIMRYDAYDSKGNLLQYTTNIDESTGNGFPTTLIYGYNNMFPIAKVQGAKTSDLQFILNPPGSPGIVTLSDQDVDEASEKLLINGLDEYRNNTQLKNFMITTYTYNPLIGVTSVTPPDGIREIYKYDANGKLKMVVDVNGNIIKEQKYNLKPQP